MSAPDGRKLLIVGLDGATFEVLDPYIAKGALPNIARMIRDGASGPLRSSIPPVTGPSWVSFMTGKGPGKHGVFDFVRRIPGEVKRRPITYRDIDARTVWDLLNEGGKSVGIVNLPITYPPPSLNGFVVPGLLTPSAEGDFAHPKGLMAEIRQAVGEYILDVWWQRYGKVGAEAFLETLLRCTRQRIATFRYLLRSRPTDVFVAVFIGSDRIQHYLWPYIHPDEESRLDPRERRIVAGIRQYYTLVDDFCGEVLDGVGGEGDVFLVSDHGFGPLRKKMYINRWLADHGYLRIDGWKVVLTNIRGRVLAVSRDAARSLDFLGLRRWLRPRIGMRGRMGAYDFLDCIGWAQTRAYSASATEQGIYINVKGREPRGIVEQGAEYEELRDELIERLRKMEDPDTGRRLVSEIHRREEIYEGPNLHGAPDIVLFLEGGEVLLDVQLRRRLFEDAGWRTGLGTHRMEGIFIACGRNVRKGEKVHGASIADLAPTILYHQGLPVPDDMDGVALSGIFEGRIPQSRRPAPTTRQREATDAEDRESALSEAERREIEQRLRALGYL